MIDLWSYTNIKQVFVVPHICFRSEKVISKNIFIKIYYSSNGNRIHRLKINEFKKNIQLHFENINFTKIYISLGQCWAKSDYKVMKV